MAKKKVQKVYIWDHPESRLQFLETTLRGDNWQAIFPFPDAERASADMAHTRALLQRRGYRVEDAKSSDGMPSLIINHRGQDRDLLTCIEEEGLVSGAWHCLRDSKQPLTEALGATKSLTRYVLSDSARALAGAYLVGDLALFVAGQYAPRDKTKHAPRINAANKLYKYATYLTLAQTFTFLAYARDGKQLLVGSLNDQYKAAEVEGMNLLNLADWSEKNRPQGPLSLFNQQFKKHPIVIGSAFMQGHNAAMMASGGLRYVEGMHASNTDMLKAGKGDTGRGALSLLGWGALTLDAKEYENKAGWDQPITRMYQEIREAPNRLASALVMTSSVLGAYGGYNKRHENPRGYKYQMGGEIIYLIGDALMFFTRKKDYGKENASQTEQMIDAASEFLRGSPLVLGPAEQQYFITQLADYVAKATLNGGAEAIDKDALIKGIIEVYEKEGSGYSKLITCTAELLAYVPAEQHRNVASHIGNLLVTAPNIAFNVEKFAETAMQAVTELPSMPTQPKDTMRALRHFMDNIEGPRKADIALKVQDVLSPYLQGVSHVGRYLSVSKEAGTRLEV